ncbi:hypothetical protein [Rossellomorea aquimaris]|uniref:Uncharacterized protein n=1 Tax=Rossellomorea aquimaris TaxID=189382 RepID=A0A1J6WRV9_9BACI|nr:hypothetical protein [Rossellomorea aquimaris]OIU68569.1 hypothetical protein BHE18_16715 [Rossellomorea aquimaris]
MFEQNNQIFLQKDTVSIRKKYTISSDKKIIGTVEETMESSKNIGRQLLNLIGLNSAASIEMKLMDEKENTIGIIKKKPGFYKDFLLYSEHGDHLATITSEVKVNSPRLTVYDVNGMKIIEATGGYGATDFQVIDQQEGRLVSTIKRRSMVYSTVKENLINDDGYYIDCTAAEGVFNFYLIAMGIVVDYYFFQH